MTYTSSSQRATTPFLGRACIIGAAATIVLSAASQVVQAGTTVPTQRYSYPWSGHGAAIFFLCAAASQLLLSAGVVGLRRSGAAGPTRAADSALLAALAGSALILVGELATIAVRNDLADSSWPHVVDAIFAVGTVASTIGFLIAGATTLRAGVWNDWRRFAPLAIGIWSVVLFGLEFTGVAPTAIGIYSACFLVLGVALSSNGHRAITVGRADARQI